MRGESALMSEERESSVSAAALTVSEERWRRYPYLDAALQIVSPPVLVRMRSTHADLQRLVHEGTARERERASLANVAYTRALALYGQLSELRDDSLAVDSNKRVKPSITK